VDCINDAISDSESVLNVGAGAGSYEPRDRFVVAVEPSAVMIRQRPIGSAPTIQATAEELPFANHALDCVLAILTIHHWNDPFRGLAEMRRVARKRVVILTWDQVVWENFWLIREYLPCIGVVDRQRAIPISRIAEFFGRCKVEVLMVPHDCIDGFHGAFWRRPVAYLDPRIRAAISTYALLSPDQCAKGLSELKKDIVSGTWQQKHRELLRADNLDVGYRLIIAERDQCSTRRSRDIVAV
jgi:SAM-dependent methyltransferase